MIVDHYDRRIKVSELCPYNAQVLCKAHAGLYPPNLPDGCRRCGWNPEEKARRIQARKEANTGDGEIVPDSTG